MRQYTEMKFKGWQGGVQRASSDLLSDEITHHGRKNLIQILPTSTGREVWKVVQQRLYRICGKHNLIEKCFGGAATSVALRADRTTSSLLDLPAAPQQAGRRSRGSFHPLTKLSAAHLPPSKDALQLPPPEQSQQYPRRIIPPKTSSLWTAALWKVLQVLQDENKQTQKLFFYPRAIVNSAPTPWTWHTYTTVFSFRKTIWIIHMTKWYV